MMAAVGKPFGTAGVLAAIRAAARPASLPDGTPYDAVGTSSVGGIALEFQRLGWEVEAAALGIGIWPERYARNMKTFSAADQARLLRGVVTVVGLGGLGGTVTEILARSGVGTLRLVDGDLFDESNLNRQFNSTMAQMGASKAEAARCRVEQINPSISASSHAVFLDQNNADALIGGSSAVVDCLDTLKYRFVLEAAAKALEIPLVSAAVAGVVGHVTTIFPADDGLKVIYGERDEVDERGVERSLGVLSHAITVLSALECAELIKILLGGGENLRNRLLIMDLSDYTFEILQLN